MTDERHPDRLRTDVARRLTPAVLRLSRRLRPSSGELALGHFSVLATLERLGPQRPSDLARIERFTQPGVTRVVAALEERGLAVRRPSPEDARSSLVEITPDGQELLHAIRVEQAEAVARLLAGLDDDSVQRLAAAIDPLEHIVYGSVRDDGDAHRMVAVGR
jgi:DNA-binding MarR family transcriptional regulator